MCLGVASRAKWAATQSHLNWKSSASVSAGCHHDVQLVSGSPISRIHAVQLRERISKPLCARIQNCRISEKSDRSESGIARTTNPRRCKISWVGQSATVNLEVVASNPAKSPKTENSNLHGFELHRPTSKGIKLLFQVIKAIINQPGWPYLPNPLDTEAEPLGHRGDKGTWGKNGESNRMSAGCAWFWVWRGIPVDTATSYWCKRVRKWQDLGHSEVGSHVRCAWGGETTSQRIIIRGGTG